MKLFTEYLSESVKQYEFRIKIAGDCEPSHIEQLKTCLEKYSVSQFKKLSTTPVQANPLDFVKLKNLPVTIFLVTLDYPTTSSSLQVYISEKLGIPKERIVVRRTTDPMDEMEEPIEPNKEALLNDGEYKEAYNAKWDDYYGDNYNSDFIKEMSAILKKQQQERNEDRPSADQVEYSTDKPGNWASVLVPAKDPRKKARK